MLPIDPKEGTIAAAIALSVGEPAFAAAILKNNGPFGRAPEKVRKEAPYRAFVFCREKVHKSAKSSKRNFGTARMSSTTLDDYKGEESGEVAYTSTEEDGVPNN